MNTQDTLKDRAARLRQWRENLGLSQKMAARVLNNTPLRTYTAWETAERPAPHLLELACLAVAHGLVIVRRK